MKCTNACAAVIVVCCPVVFGLLPYCHMDIQTEYTGVSQNFTEYM